MHMSPNPESFGLAPPKVGWRVWAPLALFAFGIPVDVVIASRIGSSSIVVGMPLVATACWHILVTNRLRALPWSLLMMVGFAAWGAVSVVWARDQDLLLTGMLTTAQLLIFVLLCWQVLEYEEALSAVLAGFVAGCTVAAAAAWKAYLEGQALGDPMYEGSARYAADGFNVNDMGATLAIGIPMAAYLALSGRHRMSYLALGYLPLAISAIALSGSRGGSLTGIVAVLGVLIWFGTRGRSQFSLALVILAVSLVTAWNLIPWEFWARILTLREQASGDGTAGGRTQIWRAGLEVLARHPIVGVGAGGFPYSVNPLLGFSAASHNTMLSVATELGVIGLVLYAGAFASVARGVLACSGDQAAFGLTLLASWLVGASSLTWELRKTTWLVLLVCATLREMRGQSPRGGLA
jgi:O-antigen ligase